MAMRRQAPRLQSLSSSDVRSPSRFWSRLRLLVRLLGVSGLLAVAVAALLAAPTVQQQGPALIQSLTALQLPETVEQLRAAVTGLLNGSKLAQMAGYLLLIGSIAALLALGVEILATLRQVAGRRSVVGANWTVQLILASVVLIAVNVYASRHFLRFDVTRPPKQFTLPPSVVAELRKLGERPTTIVVYQQHKTFGQFSSKPDAYDYAAERKVVEKVKDLVVLFEELGPQFHVVVLDVEEEDYPARLEALAREQPALKTAIEAAPENSIFFAADNKVQRLSFNDFYQLDKTSSREANGGRGNLVLLRQGVEPFARRLLALEERKPRVGIAVIHEYLTTRGMIDEYALSGMRKALESYGFEVRDIVLKKGRSVRDMESAAYTFDESKLDRLEARLANQSRNLLILNASAKRIASFMEPWRKLTLTELQQQLTRQGFRVQVTEELRHQQLKAFALELEDIQATAKIIEDERRKTDEEKARLLSDERLVEARRQTDVRHKLRQLLDECDLLIVPRMTLMNLQALRPMYIPPELHRLDAEQTAAIRDYLARGKPLLACFGPSNEPGEPPTVPEPDPLEVVLSDMGIRLLPTTVLYDVEADAMAEAQANPFGTGSTVATPPLVFAEDVLEKIHPGTSAAENPIRRAMRTIERSVRKGLELRMPHPRPVSYISPTDQVPPYRAEFLVSDSAAWRESNPFPTAERVPRYQPPKREPGADVPPRDDQRGSQVIGVAVETRVPLVWADDAVRAWQVADFFLSAPGQLTALPSFLSPEAFSTGLEEMLRLADRKTALHRPNVRVAVIGQGGWFVGPDLSPAKERLLLTTCSWLLARDDRLPRDEASVPPAERRWAYPRIELSADARLRWFWGALVGLPACFAFFGMVMHLIRRFR